MHRFGLLAGLLAALPAASLLTGCSAIDEAEPYRELQDEVSAEASEVWAVVPLAPADVRAVVAQAEGGEATLVRTPTGQWEAGPGTPPASAALMFVAEEHLFPMLAYRRLAVDASDPVFGLVGTDVRLRIETVDGALLEVVVGGPTPSGGGYYSQLLGDPYVYPVVPTVFDDILGLVAGERAVRPIDPRILAAIEAQGAAEPEEVTNPWLDQVLEASGQTAG